MRVINLFMVFFSLKHTVTLIYFQMYCVSDCTLRAIFLSSVTSTSSGPFLNRWTPSDPHHHLPPEVKLEGDSDPTGRRSSFAPGAAFSTIVAVPLPLSPTVFSGP